MTVISVLYRSAVGRSAIPYCNSDVVIKSAVDRSAVLKNYMTVTSSILQVGSRQVGNSLIGLATAFSTSAVGRSTVSLLQYSHPIKVGGRQVASVQK